MEPGLSTGLGGSRSVRKVSRRINQNWLAQLQLVQLAPLQANQPYHTGGAL